VSEENREQVRKFVHRVAINLWRVLSVVVTRSSVSEFSVMSSVSCLERYLTAANFARGVRFVSGQ
jgi:hypothetical protein